MSEDCKANLECRRKEKMKIFFSNLNLGVVTKFTFIGLLFLSGGIAAYLLFQVWNPSFEKLSLEAMTSG